MLEAIYYAKYPPLSTDARIPFSYFTIIDVGSSSHIFCQQPAVHTTVCSTKHEKAFLLVHCLLKRIFIYLYSFLSLTTQLRKPVVTITSRLFCRQMQP